MAYPRGETLASSSRGRANRAFVPAPCRSGPLTDAVVEDGSMATDPNGTYVYAGAAAASAGTYGGIYRRAAGGDRWDAPTKGLPERPQVQAITVHPDDPAVVYLGTHDGPYRSADHGATWERLDFPREGGQVWSIQVDPRDPRRLYLGASPVGVYRSDDGGDHWRRLPDARPLRPVATPFQSRVMRLAVDPGNPEEIYAGLEVGGVVRSLDGGQSWTDCSADLLALAER